MENEIYKKTFKRDTSFFDVYDIIAPLGEVLVESEDGYLISAMSYSRKEEERQVSYDIVKARYEEHIAELNEYTEARNEKVDKIAELNTEIENLDDALDETNSIVNYYESELINDEDLIDVEEEEEDERSN
jgi:septal ring factor EnvC (AmiA/AmiB activator)